MKRTWIVFLCLGLMGCASINKAMDSWMGHDKNELITSWGAPQQVLSDGNDGQIFIYANNVQWTNPGYANTYGNVNLYNNGYSTYGNLNSHTTYTPPQTYGYQKQRMFWIDSYGKIYRWAWKGL